MSIYKRWIFPVLSKFDEERTHNAAVWLLEKAQQKSIGRLLLEKSVGPIATNPVELFGLTFPNPIGIAAGFDKDARIGPALALLGFGHVEVGTLTPLPQEGNAKPRLFRLRENRALFNRMGFPNQGVYEAAVRLERSSVLNTNYIVGVSIGKQRETGLEEAAHDYCLVMESTYKTADYFAINVSSPNTPGLRELQGSRYLQELLNSLRDHNNELAQKNKKPIRPLLLKISPDLNEGEIDSLLDTALSAKISGIIAANTSSRMEIVSRSPRQPGGLSGRPLAELSDRIISYIHGATQGSLPIVGVGGIFNADDVRRKMDAGASLVQLYTGLIYEGPFLVRNILKKLENNHGY